MEIIDYMKEYDIKIEDVKEILYTIAYGTFDDMFTYIITHEELKKASILVLKAYSDILNNYYYINTHSIYSTVLNAFGLSEKDIDTLY